jgi:hypothetical protein
VQAFLPIRARMVAGPTKPLAVLERVLGRMPRFLRRALLMHGPLHSLLKNVRLLGHKR